MITQFEINDPFLGKRVVDVGGPQKMLPLIRDQHKMLCKMRQVQGPTKTLNEDIRAYEAILNSFDPVGRCDAYFIKKEAMRGNAPEMAIVSIRPYVVVKELGWLE